MLLIAALNLQLLGAPHGFSNAAMRHSIMFHDITKRGGCGMGS